LFAAAGALFTIAVLGGGGAAHAAGGAFATEDADVEEPGSCKVESWTSFADNRDFIGVVAPACVVNLGRPVELGAQGAHFRSAGAWGTTFGFKGKLNLNPVDPGKLGLGLISGFTYDVTGRAVNNVFVILPVTWQVHEQVRININGGLQADPGAGTQAALWGVGFEWKFVKPLTLIGEVFGIAGGDESAKPRAQIGLRMTPRESFDIDVIYGRNITGENANWITVGLNVRFNVAGKAAK
jgi:hypothetical protein